MQPPAVDVTLKAGEKSAVVDNWNWNYFHCITRGRMGQHCEVREHLGGGHLVAMGWDEQGHRLRLTGLQSLV